MLLFFLTWQEALEQLPKSLSHLEVIIALDIAFQLSYSFLFTWLAANRGSFVEGNTVFFRAYHTHTVLETEYLNDDDVYHM